MVVGALDNRDGVDLDIADVINRLPTTCQAASKGFRLQQALSREGETTQAGQILWALELYHR